MLKGCQKPCCLLFDGWSQIHITGFQPWSDLAVTDFFWELAHKKGPDQGWIKHTLPLMMDGVCELFGDSSPAHHRCLLDIYQVKYLIQSLTLLLLSSLNPVWSCIHSYEAGATECKRESLLNHVQSYVFSTKTMPLCVLIHPLTYIVFFSSQFQVWNCFLTFLEKCELGEALETWVTWTCLQEMQMILLCQSTVQCHFVQHVYYIMLWCFVFFCPEGDGGFTSLTILFIVPMYFWLVKGKN